MILVYLFLTIIIGFSKSDQNDLIETAVSIASDVYKPFHLTTVAWWDYDNEYVNEFLLKYIGTLTTIKVKECIGQCQKTFNFKQTVFFADKPEEFDDFLAIANNITSEAKLIILVIININITNDLIDFTEIAWKRDVIDIVAVSKTFNDTIVVSTLVPYRSGICGDFSPIDMTMNRSNIFKESKYKNFHRCPIRVTAVELMPYVELIKENDTVIDIGGIDGRLIKLVIEKLNATMNIVSASDHGDLGYYVNGTAWGSFGDIYYNNADVLAPALMLNTRRYPAAQISSIFRQSYIILCLPQRGEIYKWIKVLLPFYNWATPLIIAAAIGIYSTLRFINIFGHKNNNLPQGIVFGIYSLFFGQFYNISSKYWLINSLFVSWIWCSLVFRISYEGRLVEGLHHIILEPPVRNFEEAIKAVNEVRLYPTLLEFYRNTPIEKHGIIISLPDILETLFAIADGKKYLLAIESGQAKLYKKNIQIVEDQIVNSPSCFYLRPRFPAAEYISRVILRITETGQFDKIMDEFFSGWDLHNINKTITLHVEPLGMNILGSCFLGLLVMYVVCLLVFGVEIFYNYYIKRRGLSRLAFVH